MYVLKDNRPTTYVLPAGGASDGKMFIVISEVIDVQVTHTLSISEQVYKANEGILH